MVGITEFIGARLDEDEELARRGTVWRREGINSVEDAHGGLVVYGDGTPPSSGEADHITRHDPARVLGQVAVLRAIVDLHEPNHTNDCRVCLDVAYLEGVFMESWPCPTLRQLAAIWSTHPEYDSAWAVD